MRSTTVPATGDDAPRRRARLLVLLCDTPVPPVLETKGTYADIFTTLFRRSLELRRRDEPGLREVQLDIDSYDVVKAGEYPDDAALAAADGLVMTGSGPSTLRLRRAQASSVECLRPSAVDRPPRRVRR